jgi:hypothetical protein
MIDLEIEWLRFLDRFPCFRPYLRGRARRLFEENPVAFINELFNRLETQMKLDDPTDSKLEYLEELTNGVCEDLAFLAPYKASILNFLTNKAARDLKR